MTTWRDILLGSLATYYLALSVTRMEGPWAIFDKLRVALSHSNDWKARGIMCLVCVSLYSALVVVVGLWALGRLDPYDAPLVWLGLAGASVMLDKYWQR